MFKKTLRQELATEVLASDARHCMLFGGSRSGKTFTCIRSIFIRACKEPSRHVAIRNHFNSAKTSLWLDTIPKVQKLCFPDLEVKKNRSDYYIKFPNDSEFWIAGLDDDKRAEKILGKEYSTIFFSECSELSYYSVQLALTRLAEKNDLRKKAYYDQNPPKKSHWTYWQFEKKLSPKDNVPLSDPDNYIAFLMNPFDNLENIDPDYIKTLEALPQEEKERFLHGRYTDTNEGQVYYAFNREKHVAETKLLPSLGLYIGMDFNVAPMTALICQVYDDTFWVHDEAWLMNSDTNRMMIYLKGLGYIGEVIPDSTGRNRKTSGMSDFQIIKEHGYSIRPTVNPFVTDRVSNVNRLLGIDRVIINPKCKKLINDLEKVGWKDNKLDQSGSNKELTHISDCLGYVLHALEPIVAIRRTEGKLL